MPKEKQYEIGVENSSYSPIINGKKIDEILMTEELVNYQYIHREDFTDDLMNWISEAGYQPERANDKKEMKEDLKYLMKLEDEYIFKSVRTNEYIAFSDNPKRFNEIIEELLDAQKVIDYCKKKKKDMPNSQHELWDIENKIEEEKIKKQVKATKQKM